VADQRERLVLLTPRSHCAVGATGSSGARPGRASTLESAPISLTNKRAVSSARSFPLCTQWPTRTPAARARAATRCTAARPAPRERPLGVLGVNRRLAALHQVQVHDGHLRCLLHHPAQPAIHRTHREAEVLGVPGTSLQTRRAEGGRRVRFSLTSAALARAAFCGRGQSPGMPTQPARVPPRRTRGGPSAPVCLGGLR
jgi:hypothetical protein